MKFLRSLLIPHHSNAYKPHLIRRHGLGLVLVLTLGIQLLTALQLGDQQHVLGYATNISVSGLLANTNAERAAAGLTELDLSDQLNHAAQSKAEHMIAQNYWAHTSPDGTTPWFFFDQADYIYLAAGENLAYGFDTSSGVLAGWMDSPGHRANVLHIDYQDVGFGIANGSNFQGGANTVVVAMYGDPAAAAQTNTSTAQSGPQAVLVDEAESPSNSEAIPSEPLVVVSVASEPKRVSNLEAALSGEAQWSLYMTIAVLGLISFIYAYRHLLFLHNFLVRGERFVVAHPLLEASLIYLALGLVLSGTHGVIF